MARKQVVVFLAAEDGVERDELRGAWRILRAAGYATELWSSHPGRVRIVRGLKRLGSASVDRVLGREPGRRQKEVVGVVVPGGIFGANLLRQDAAAVEFLFEAAEQGTLVASIGHGLSVLVEAGVVDGRQVTGPAGLRTDLVNAGARWLGEQGVVEDRGVLSCRGADDLAAFGGALVEAVRLAGRRAADEAARADGVAEAARADEVAQEG